MGKMNKIGEMEKLGLKPVILEYRKKGLSPHKISRELYFGRKYEVSPTKLDEAIREWGDPLSKIAKPESRYSKNIRELERRGYIRLILDGHVEENLGYERIIGIIKEKEASSSEARKPIYLANEMIGRAIDIWIKRKLEDVPGLKDDILEMDKEMNYVSITDWLKEEGIGIESSSVRRTSYKSGKRIGRIIDDWKIESLEGMSVEGMNLQDFVLGRKYRDKWSPDRILGHLYDIGMEVEQHVLEKAISKWPKPARTSERGIRKKEEPIKADPEIDFPGQGSKNIMPARGNKKKSMD